MSVARRIAEIPGVQFVQTRISRFATLDIEGFAEPVIGRLTSIPDTGQPILNQLALRSGRWIEPDRHNEVIISEPFAEAHELLVRVAVAAHGGALRRELAQQPDELEEVEAGGALVQLLAQRSVASPARGGHRLSSPWCWRMRATTCVNELIEV